MTAARNADELEAQADALQQQEDERIGMVTVDSAYLFTAPVQWLEPGTTLTWVNESGSHSTTAYASANDRPDRIPANAEAWDSGVLTEEGATFEHTFDEEGVYDYYCTPHESLGMVARLVVGTPNIENSPALAEPQSSLPDTAQEIIRGLNTLTVPMVGGN
ncbi:plastocyanin/azurin family copper-binding protein [Natrinema sp. 1APR25-10V2]|uniref:plastocyanin/azurin family copper-binding protein n=1 Tax=Natrinema sp. 1APR25-10V2 TaxID=2951081 RepID=UPI0028766250|nr:plastocyanin/azurin family copper-binding protein [Natrinema sp. 1APR25-10V2]MDS0473948.1 plastocyanin/azurin family copper-binding protein [Natrinema sp. 1APR25-10V2]